MQSITCMSTTTAAVTSTRDSPAVPRRHHPPRPEPPIEHLLRAVASARRTPGRRDRVLAVEDVSGQGPHRHETERCRAPADPIAAGQRAGELTPGNPVATAPVIRGAAEALIGRAVTDPDLDLAAASAGPDRLLRRTHAAAAANPDPARWHHHRYRGRSRFDLLLSR